MLKKIITVCSHILTALAVLGLAIAVTTYPPV